MLHNQYTPEVRTPGPFALISFTQFDECASASFWECFQLQSINYQMIFSRKQWNLDGTPVRM